MRPILISGPAVEPVPLGEARMWLRYDTASEDETITLAVISARQAIEQAAKSHMITQRWRFLADSWPAGLVVPLPLYPVQSVDAVRIYDANGLASLLPSTAYRLSRSGVVPRLKFTTPPPAPGISASGIEIDVTTGFGATANDVPGPLRQAIRLMVARWFDNRGDLDAGRLPADVLALIAPYRPLRLA
jgi:uncharacterized phiE125 gp8 family phage protein